MVNFSQFSIQPLHNVYKTPYETLFGIIEKRMYHLHQHKFNYYLIPYPPSETHIYFGCILNVYVIYRFPVFVTCSWNWMYQMLNFKWFHYVNIQEMVISNRKSAFFCSSYLLIHDNRRRIGKMCCVLFVTSITIPNEGLHT